MKLLLEIDAMLAGHLLHECHLLSDVGVHDVVAARTEHDHVPRLAGKTRELMVGQDVVHLESGLVVSLSALLAAPTVLAVAAVAQFLDTS